MNVEKYGRVLFGLFVVVVSCLPMLVGSMMPTATRACLSETFEEVNFSNGETAICEIHGIKCWNIYE